MYIYNNNINLKCSRYLVVGCDSSASITKCHTLNSIAYTLSHYIDDPSPSESEIANIFAFEKCASCDTMDVSIYLYIYSIQIIIYLFILYNFISKLIIRIVKLIIVIIQIQISLNTLLYII